MKEKIKSWFRRMLLAFQLMTRIPVNMTLPCEPADMAGSMVFFPLVGGVVGLAMALGIMCARWAIGTHLAAAFIAVLIETLITGGIHLDGLGDVCDGFFSGRGRERILEIMHDSRTGTFGALGLILTLLGETAFIAAILQHRGDHGMWYVASVPVLSRMCVVCLEFIGKSARDGMGSAYVKGLTPRLLGSAALICIALVLMFRPVTLIGLPIAALIAYGLNMYFTRKIGGLTGDTLGAANCLCALILYGAWAMLK